MNLSVRCLPSDSTDETILSKPQSLKTFQPGEIFLIVLYISKNDHGKQAKQSFYIDQIHTIDNHPALGTPTDIYGKVAIDKQDSRMNDANIECIIARTPMDINDSSQSMVFDRYVDNDFDECIVVFKLAHPPILIHTNSRMKISIGIRASTTAISTLILLNASQFLYVVPTASAIGGSTQKQLINLISTLDRPITILKCRCNVMFHTVKLPAEIRSQESLGLAIPTEFESFEIELEVDGKVFSYLLKPCRVPRSIPLDTKVKPPKQVVAGSRFVIPGHIINNGDDEINVNIYPDSDNNNYTIMSAHPVISLKGIKPGFTSFFNLKFIAVSPGKYEGSLFKVACEKKETGEIQQFSPLNHVSLMVTE
eukprot:TRINITY_DN284_c0_g1_i1.p1 TRINITY_DN284_c0_g1~~TRINITY_DN284_c0_g1_i1.p1  ORF type:complete len:376 (-),score=83.10 TRINITY_DN284_c0_g1_i1:165-1262(-)